MDILETLSGIHIIYQIAGLSSSLIERKTWILKNSRLLEVYCSIIMLIAILFLIFGIFVEHSFIGINNSDLEQAVDFIQMLGIRIAHIAVISESLLKRNEQKRMYEEIRQIDRIFERSLNVDVNNKKFRRNTILFGSLMAFVYFAVEFFSLASNITSHQVSYYFFWFFYFVPLLICGIRYFQIFTCIRVLRHRFHLLVKVLTEINLKIQTNEMEDVYSVERSVDHKYSLFLMEPLIVRDKCCDMENPELKKLLIVRDIYNRLYHLSETINCYFGMSLLFNVISDFLSSISNCFWIFYNFYDSHTGKNYFLQMAGSSVWTLRNFANVVVLALLCDGTVQKSKKIALNLHRINIDIWNDNHNTVIEQFSLQLLHQKISITAAGFFSIDCTLLNTIVGATTTYIIIYIQFHMSETKSTN